MSDPSSTEPPPEPEPESEADRLARAERLRAEIEALTSAEPRPIPRHESPHDFIQRRMRELREKPPEKAD